MGNTINIDDVKLVGRTPGIVFLTEDKSYYTCPKHGRVTYSDGGQGAYSPAIHRTPHIDVTCGPEDLQGHYCMLCFSEWITAHIPKLRRVEAPR